MSFDAPDLSQILTNEQTMNTKLTNLKSQLQDILDDNTISYESSDAILPLIRKLPYPVPTSIQWNCFTSWLTNSGPQSRYNSARGYPVVRDQNGNSMANVPITVRRKAIGGSTWSNYGTYVAPCDVYMYPDSNKDGHVYEVYVTANPSVSAQLTLPQYWFNYTVSDYNYSMGEVLDTSNLLISNNVQSIDTTYLDFGTNYFDIIADSSAEMLVAIPLKNTPTILGANSNTNIYIAYDITRGTTSSSSVINGVGGGMVGNGSRNSMGIFLDSSDADFMSTYGTSFSSTHDYGYTESGTSKECIVRIPGGSSGAYTWFENSDGSISHYGPYWYGSMIGDTYAPCLIVYNNNMVAGGSLRVKLKYIRATAP